MQWRSAKWLVTALLTAACTFDSTGLGADETLGETLGGTGDDGEIPGATSDPSSPQSTVGMDSDDGERTSTSGPDSDSDSDSGSVSTSGSTSSTDPSTTTAESSSTGAPEASPWCDPSWPDLAACYRFQDLNAGVLVDESAAGNHGTVAGIGIETGPLGEAAALFDASVVQAPAHPMTDLAPPATLEMWLRVDALPTENRIGVLDRDGQYSLFLYADTGLRCGAHTFAYWQPVTVGEWMHVGCVMDVDTVRLYVDGALLDEVSWDPSIPTGNQNPMALGNESPGFTQPLSGAIGGVRLWSAARTEIELCEAAGDLCP